MAKCDLCDIEKDESSLRRYSASEFRKAVDAGLRPEQLAARYGSLFGMSAEEMKDGWVKEVMRDPGDWAVCDECCLKVEEYLKCVGRQRWLLILFIPAIGFFGAVAAALGGGWKPINEGDLFGGVWIPDHVAILFAVAGAILGPWLMAFCYWVFAPFHEQNNFGSNLFGGAFVGALFFAVYGWLYAWLGRVSGGPAAGALAGFFLLPGLALLLGTPILLFGLLLERLKKKT